MKQINVMLDRKGRVHLEDLQKGSGLGVTEIVHWALNEFRERGPYEPEGLGLRARLIHTLREDRGWSLQAWCDTKAIGFPTMERVISRVDQGGGLVNFQDGTEQMRGAKLLIEDFPEIMLIWGVY